MEEETGEESVTLACQSWVELVGWMHGLQAALHEGALSLLADGDLDHTPPHFRVVDAFEGPAEELGDEGEGGTAGLLRLTQAQGADSFFTLTDSQGSHVRCSLGYNPATRELWWCGDGARGSIALPRLQALCLGKGGVPGTSASPFAAEALEARCMSLLGHGSHGARTVAHLEASSCELLLAWLNQLNAVLMDLGNPLMLVASDGQIRKTFQAVHTRSVSVSCASMRTRGEESFTRADEVSASMMDHSVLGSQDDDFGAVLPLRHHSTTRHLQTLTTISTTSITPPPVAIARQ
jgi:hypothetical protein